MSDGYISEGSIVRQVAGESVLLLGARTALLMQLAHPLVAQGVKDHSQFQGDRWQRLVRTVRASMTMVFGSRAESDEVIARIKQAHAGVAGRLSESCGCWQQGHEYRAEDPDLLLWVHATLVDTAVRFHDRFVRLLSPEEKNGYVTDLAPIAAALGIVDHPASWDDLQMYIFEMIGDRYVEVGEVARELARPILYPALPLVPDRLFRPLVAITASMLPEPIRLGYGIHAGWTDAAVTATVSLSLRRLRPVVPVSLRNIGAGGVG